MPTTHVPANPLAPDSARRTEPSCTACPHPADAHDALARRFCSATRTGDLRRGCLCSRESGGATYGKSGGGNISDRA